MGSVKGVVCPPLSWQSEEPMEKLMIMVVPWMWWRATEKERVSRSKGSKWRKEEKWKGEEGRGKKEEERWKREKGNKKSVAGTTTMKWARHGQNEARLQVHWPDGSGSSSCSSSSGSFSEGFTQMTLSERRYRLSDYESTTLTAATRRSVVLFCYLGNITQQGLWATFRCVT